MYKTARTQNGSFLYELFAVEEHPVSTDNVENYKQNLPPCFGLFTGRETLKMLVCIWADEVVHPFFDMFFSFHHSLH